jgi:hypothetical protein
VLYRHFREYADSVNARTLEWTERYNPLGRTTMMYSTLEDEGEQFGEIINSVTANHA